MTMKYAFHLKDNTAVKAQGYDINASFKDMCSVCDAIRYKQAGDAMLILDDVSEGRMPILYRRHNKRMGSRSELGGRKGAYPMKAAGKVMKVLQNAIANANGKGEFGDEMYVVHASANKTRIERRQPSKGTLFWGRGMYGRGSIVHSDIEYAKVEIALARGDEEWLTDNMKYFIGKNRKRYDALKAKEKHAQAKASTAKPKKPQPKEGDVQKEAKKIEETVKKDIGNKVAEKKAAEHKSAAKEKNEEEKEKEKEKEEKK